MSLWQNSNFVAAIGPHVLSILEAHQSSTGLANIPPVKGARSCVQGSFAAITALLCLCFGFHHSKMFATQQVFKALIFVWDNFLALP